MLAPGPTRCRRWNSGQETELVLAAFPKYWGGWSGTHYKRVVFRVVPQDTTAAQLLTSGQVSFVEQLSPSLWASLKNNPQVQTVNDPSWQNLFALMNCKTGPLANLTVRQAVSYAIDYSGIVAALKGAVVPSSGVVPPGSVGPFRQPAQLHLRLLKGSTAAELGGLRARQEADESDAHADAG